MNRRESPLIHDIVPLSEGLVNSVAKIEEESFAQPVSRQAFLLHLDPATSRFKVAIAKDGGLVGYAGLVLEGHLGHIVKLVTASQFRRRGVARALMRTLQREVAQMGLVGAVLEVRPTNTSARRLYEETGFSYGRMKRTFYEDGQDACGMIWRNLHAPRNLLQAAKSAARRRGLDQRRALSEQERRRKSGIACRFLMDRPEFKAARTILFYLALPDEVDAIEAFLTAARAGQRLCAPATESVTGRITPCLVSDLGDLDIRTRGILEPDPDRHPAVAPQEIDMVIVPGIAFDGAGGRVGFGKGSYDGILSHALHARTVGLAYEAQLSDLVPMGPQDVTLERIITERGVYGG